MLSTYTTPRCVSLSITDPGSRSFSSRPPGCPPAARSDSSVGAYYIAECYSEDTSPPREDDPASIGNDDGGRLSSGSECDDDDADCDGAAALPNGDSNVVTLTR